MAVASALACCLLEARKWSINKMIKNMHGPEQYPIIGVGHRFIGKDNEGNYKSYIDSNQASSYRL